MLTTATLGVATAFVLMFGFTASAQASLTQSQIEAVLGLLEAFGADAATLADVEATLTGSVQSPVVERFGRDLSVGSTGEDVRRLQQWLNGNGYLVAESGAGSPGNESTYYGERTQRAVSVFQRLNDIRPIDGNFGSATRSAINLKIATETETDKDKDELTITGWDAPTLLTAGDPQLGNFFVGVEGANDMDLIYEIDWGNGSAEKQPNNPSFQYTYGEPGTYTVTAVVTSAEGLTGKSTWTVTVEPADQDTTLIVQSISDIASGRTDVLTPGGRARVIGEYDSSRDNYAVIFTGRTHQKTVPATLDFENALSVRIPTDLDQGEQYSVHVIDRDTERQSNHITVEVLSDDPDTRDEVEAVRNQIMEAINNRHSAQVGDSAYDPNLDLNGDGVIDEKDTTLVLIYPDMMPDLYSAVEGKLTNALVTHVVEGRTEGDENYIPEFDFNGDGVVDTGDVAPLVQFLTYWGTPEW